MSLQWHYARVIFREGREIKRRAINRSAKRCHHGRVPIKNSLLFYQLFHPSGNRSYDLERCPPRSQSDCTNVCSLFYNQILEKKTKKGGTDPLSGKGSYCHEGKQSFDHG